MVKIFQIIGQESVAKPVTATHVILEGEHQDISVSNATFSDQIIKQ
jgi:hypothetical protein